MADWEQTDALLHWLASFDLESDSFIQDPNKLLDGRVFATIYNKIASDSIDISKLSQVNKESDWIYMLLNMRQIASHITPLLKENGFDLSVDLNSLVRKKDQNELLKFLKYFLFFSMKAPNRKISISGVRSLDKSYQIHIQTILEEFTSKKKEQDSETSAQQQLQQAQKANAESQAQKQKLQQLKSEIEKLKAKSAEKEQEIKQKTTEVEQIDSDINNKIQSAINEVKDKYSKESAARESILAEIKQHEESIENAKKQVSDLKAKEQEISKELEKGNVSELSALQLNTKLKIIKRKAMKIITTDESGNSDDKEPPSVEEIISLFKIPEKKATMNKLKDFINNYDKNVLMKKAELDAMKAQLDEQNKKASTALLRRVAQLNAEMDASPLGEGKRKTFQLRRAIQKLGNDIENLEKNNGNFAELPELQKELTNMAQRKAYESDLLAKKLSFMQSTAEQCGLRLERLKLHVGLQMHSNRLNRWKNCFSSGFEKPRTT
ncbi:hypothetical protein M9Y10_032800 [Tritrichomonas musculus]|uniref:Calponin-homology (CH) domain-containing protein n=1 Tax=Tritrichomonas musculus TaxID=1915356 RepID=A0ABR2GYQ6_9EUKA